MVSFKCCFALKRLWTEIFRQAGVLSEVKQSLSPSILCHEFLLILIKQRKVTTGK